MRVRGVLAFGLFALAAIAEAQITEFPIPSDGSPFDLTAGPDGNLWFCSNGSNRIVNQRTPSGPTSRKGALAKESGTP